MPIDVDHGAFASAPALVCRLVAVAAVVGDASVPFIEGHSKLADRERLSDRHPDLRLVHGPLRLLGAARREGHVLERSVDSFLIRRSGNLADRKRLPTDRAATP